MGEDIRTPSSHASTATKIIIFKGRIIIFY